MKAVVFGGSGFIGKHLVADLLYRGYDVTVADIARGDVPAAAHFAECDVREPIQLDIADTPLEVYNLAALHRVPGHEDREYLATNVAGAENVAHYCEAVGVERLFFTSSISVYAPSELPLDEDAPTTPVSAYGRSKLEAESIHRRWALGRPARRLVIARPGVIFGPGERGNFELLARALRQRTFVYPGRSDTVKACAYVGELIRSFEFASALDRRLFLYNLCYPHPYTVQEICEAFHREWGLPLPTLTVPAPTVMAAAWLFERLESAGIRTGIGRARVRKLMESTHIVPRALGRAGYEFETELAEGLRRWQLGSAVAPAFQALSAGTPCRT
jgi:nucleoside-diphosphate-sugar epimerase